MERTEKEKFLAGELYNALDAELVADRDKATALSDALNNSRDESEKKRVCKELFGSFGENSSIRPNFRCDYGFNISFGNNCDINFDCTFLDCAKISIGDYCFMGPGVHIYAVNHPLDGVERRKGVEYSKEVSIGNDCWVGGRVTICPGVKIGNNVTIGAGSLVTKDVPDNVLVVGSPARIVKQLK
jgi:maltose O-acetyltransferase